MVLGTRFLGHGITQILDIHFQIALTSEHVWLVLVEFRSASWGGVADENRWTEDRR